MAKRQDPVGTLALEALYYDDKGWKFVPAATSGWCRFLLYEIGVVKPAGMESVAQHLVTNENAAERLVRRWRDDPDHPRPGGAARLGPRRRGPSVRFVAVSAGQEAGADITDRCTTVRTETLIRWERAGLISRAWAEGHGCRDRKRVTLTAAGVVKATGSGANKTLDS